MRACGDNGSQILQDLQVGGKVDAAWQAARSEHANGYAQADAARPGNADGKRERLHKCLRFNHCAGFFRSSKTMVAIYTE